jgi:DNA processing protein
MTRPEDTPNDSAPYTLKRCSDRYPELLNRISDPPEVLYVRGEISDAPRIAVVGSRDCSEYGRQVAYRLAADIVRAGFVVVSGLARGIDAASHVGALDVGGETIAVLPCGIDTVYPPRHVGLAARIAGHGAVVTEFEPGTRVRRSSFLERNRIIAGLAAATIVVEAAHRSGAKITANYALQYDREVMAVPGPVGSRTSAGANSLLAEGAGVCTGVESLLAQLPVTYHQAAQRRLEISREDRAAVVHGLNDGARSILEAIPETGCCGVEHLATATSLPIGELLAVLTDMEVRGLIRSIGSQRYERA